VRHAVAIAARRLEKRRHALGQKIRRLYFGRGRCFNRRLRCECGPLPVGRLAILGVRTLSGGGLGMRRRCAASVLLLGLFFTDDGRVFLGRVWSDGTGAPTVDAGATGWRRIEVAFAKLFESWIHGFSSILFGIFVEQTRVPYGYRKPALAIIAHQLNVEAFRF
jgi:hypothetical protein